jgi:hypothetical protein
VNIELQGGWSGENLKHSYHEIVEQHAADGWRLVQIFAPATSGVGKAVYFELLFERPTE